MGDVIVFFCIVFGEFCVGVCCLMRGVSNGEFLFWYFLISNVLMIWLFWWEVKGIESFLDFLGGVGDNGYVLNSLIWFEN